MDGYRKAIQDTIDIFEYVQPDLKQHHKRLNDKLAMQLLRVILENRAWIRDGFNGFVRFNGRKNEFEWFDGVNSR